MATATSQNVVPLMDVLRERQARAQAHTGAYLAPVPDEENMLFWLARAARQARATAGRLQVHVAASASVNQSTIDRFEKGLAWPRNPDRVLKAYAEDLDVDSIDLWDAALRMWRDDRSTRAMEQELAADDQPSVPRADSTDGAVRSRRRGGRAR